MDGERGYVGGWVGCCCWTNGLRVVRQELTKPEAQLPSVAGPTQEQKSCRQARKAVTNGMPFGREEGWSMGGWVGGWGVHRRVRACATPAHLA
jgi:hypothetical protein